MIYVHVQRLRLRGEPVPPQDQHRQPLRAWLWILPGCLIEGCGPVYRSLDAYLTIEPKRPDTSSIEGCKATTLFRLGDTRTRIDKGVLMVYGSELVALGGGGHTVFRQVWACRQVG